MEASYAYPKSPIIELKRNMDIDVVKKDYNAPMWRRLNHANVKLESASPAGLPEGAVDSVCNDAGDGILLNPAMLLERVDKKKIAIVA